eukprot:UN12715
MNKKKLKSNTVYVNSKTAFFTTQNCGTINAESHLK